MVPPQLESLSPPLSRSLRITVTLLNVEAAQCANLLTVGKGEPWLKPRYQVPARCLPLNARGHGVSSGVHLYGLSHSVGFTSLQPSVRLCSCVLHSVVGLGNGRRPRNNMHFSICECIGVTTDLLVYSLIVPIIPFQLEDLGYTGVSGLVGWLLFAYVSSMSPCR